MWYVVCGMRLDLELNEDGGRSDYPYVGARSELSTFDVGLATLLRACDRVSSRNQDRRIHHPMNDDGDRINHMTKLLGK